MFAFFDRCQTELSNCDFMDSILFLNKNKFTQNQILVTIFYFETFSILENLK